MINVYFDFEPFYLLEGSILKYGLKHKIVRFSNLLINGNNPSSFNNQCFSLGPAISILNEHVSMDEVRRLHWLNLL